MGEQEANESGTKKITVTEKGSKNDDISKKFWLWKNIFFDIVKLIALIIALVGACFCVAFLMCFIVLRVIQILS